MPSVVCRSILGRWLPGSRGAATSSPLLGIALLLCGIGPGPGCAGRDWRAAKGAHTGAAYRAFVTANPEHYKVPEAMERAEVLDWAAAEESQTPAAYSVYLGAHPQGPHAAEAYARAEVLAWDEAVEQGTPEALSAYLARYPSSERIGLANDLIEDAWFERAKTEGTEASWGRYIVRYPEGTHLEEAQRERERLAWEGTVEQNNREGYERFVTRFPTSEHLGEAQRWLEASRVSVLQPVVVLGDSWQPKERRASIARRIRGEFDRGLLYDLERDFKIKRTLMVDLNGGPAPHPQEAYGIEPDVGLLVLTCTETEGRRFEPSGTATDISATLELFVPPTPDPVWAISLSASTPERAYGSSVDALHQAAVLELAGQLRGFADDLARERRGGL
ncbi:MAG TPA: hypothetical protein ENK18_23295 [Deltaproteobacteria bacterium]|nr:hypothetical protein [Deltaproteobacteria bacterium]